MTAATTSSKGGMPATVSDDNDHSSDVKHNDEISDRSSPPLSRSSSSSNLSGFDKKESVPGKNARLRQSLKERSKIPASAYVTVSTVLGLQYFSGLYFSLIDVFMSLKDSVVTSSQTGRGALVYLRDLCQSIAQGEVRETKEYLYASTVALMVGSISYVLVYAPLRAGMWTGNRARRHKTHRYFGLLFLIQYALAWIELLTNYEDGGRSTYLTHTIALNGIIQAMSAYFSFKVLPELDDAGYYSDKAVMSRRFVHENIFYQLMTVFGSVFYNDVFRANLLSSRGGRILAYVFCFFPYVVLRPLFPTTRFKDAGKSMAGRSEKLERFYRVGTKMIKFFYLWAKYFLGFYINWMVLLDLVTEENWKFMRGLYLLNAGTVSIAVFLHTLRFKKVLPPWLTFSLYLGQIYATFSAIPYAYGMFSSHKMLCSVAFTGILANMTRDRKIHAAWCVSAMSLLIFADVDW